MFWCARGALRRLQGQVRCQVLRQEVLRGQEIKLPASAYRRSLHRAGVDVAVLWRAAQDSVAGFAQATQDHGSLLQSWVHGAAVREHEHYPADDVVDLRRGSQFYYHAHRDADAEHGHVHLFWHATASGRRRYARAGRQGWLRSAPTHLLAIGLDPRGLPVSLFTVNRWVSGGPWFDAPTTLAMARRFHVAADGEHAASCRWLNGFVRMYEPLIGELLAARDAALPLADERREVLSQVRIDWGRDLEALERSR
jgi:hypothetical protein